jgi:hypothetical protein
VKPKADIDDFAKQLRLWFVIGAGRLLIAAIIPVRVYRVRLDGDPFGFQM